MVVKCFLIKKKNPILGIFVKRCACSCKIQDVYWRQFTGHLYFTYFAFKQGMEISWNILFLQTESSCSKCFQEKRGTWQLKQLEELTLGSSIWSVITNSIFGGSASLVPSRYLFIVVSAFTSSSFTSPWLGNIDNSISISSSWSCRHSWTDAEDMLPRNQPARKTGKAQGRWVCQSAVPSEISPRSLCAGAVLQEHGTRRAGGTHRDT